MLAAKVHIIILSIACLCQMFVGLASAESDSFRMASGHFLADEDALNLYCLRLSYPDIRQLEKAADGRQWLYLADGRKLLYSGKNPEPAGLSVDIRESMAQPYFLEPMRPETPSGYAPGRKRPYELLAALYGASSQAVRASLIQSRFQGKNINLAPAAARAFARASGRLEAIAASDATMRRFLRPDGAFYWRKIAGENVRSGHSYGIAIDLGADKAPYWRWSGVMPHPMQKSYPSEIVKSLEEEGFVWGGKWHEYDLMHFEYRPELICKARLKALHAGPGKQALPNQPQGHNRKW